MTLSTLLDRVRTERPLVHHITNVVTINDCANITLAVGASPVMAEAQEEVAEMASMADALVLNIGTLTASQVQSMLIAGRAANDRGVPIVLDPVGAGATQFRTDSVLRLLDQLDIAILKGNAGEIGTLAGVSAEVRGVDSGGIEGDPGETCRQLAERLGIVVAMSGAVDFVSDGVRLTSLENGHPLMDRVSGTGCMLSSVVGSFASISEDHYMATVAAMVTYGLAGERAALKAKGPGSFRFKMIDALASLGFSDIESGARIRSI
ncbi:MAG: hydroxyethylthiazole kinase [Methanoregulaceae archaeon]